MRSVSGGKLARKGDLSITASGKPPAADTYTIESTTLLTGITGFRLEVIPGSGAAIGPGRTAHGNFVLSSFKVETVGPDGQTNLIKLSCAIADFSQPEL